MTVPERPAGARYEDLFERTAADLGVLVATARNQIQAHGEPQAAVVIDHMADGIPAAERTGLLTAAILLLARLPQDGQYQRAEPS